MQTAKEQAETILKRISAKLREEYAEPSYIRDYYLKAGESCTDLIEALKHVENQIEIELKQ